MYVRQWASSLRPGGASSRASEEWKSTARQLRNGTSAMARKESTNATHLVATATRQALRQAEPAGDVPGTRPEDPSRDSRGGKTTFTRQNDAACGAELRKGFTTLAGVAILNTIQGARTTRKVLETLTATQGAQPSTGME